MKILKYSILLAASLGFASCNDLEQSPSNQFTDTNFWTSIDRAQNMVNMAYSQMYSASTMWSDESLSDNMIDGRSLTDERLIRRGMATPSLGTFSGTWGSLYGGIKTCNVFLGHIGDLQADEAVKERMIAEVRFIRAMIYFRLTNLYGAVPFFTRDITLDEANTIRRTPREDVVDFIHAELDDIMMTLPSRDMMPEAENGKISRGAVAMLQARVYLMDSDWENVIKYCDMLINQQGTYGTYRLFDTYGGLFKEKNEYNCEVILDRSYVPNLITWGEMVDMAPLSAGARVINRVPLQSLVDAYRMINGKRIDESGSGYDVRNPYANRDPRLSETVCYDGYRWNEHTGSGPEVIITRPGGGTPDSYTGPGNNQSVTAYYTAKYFSPQTEGDLNSGLNIIMMRYADVLLMYAEAMFETGRMTQDVWDMTIRPIRERAGFTNRNALKYPATASEDAMRSLIRDERRVELALEGLRWWDIKRWKAGKEYLDGMTYGATFDGNRLQVENRSFDENRDYLWAVPMSQINLNSNLLPQNPGYSN